jgi:hypothetical protein
VVSDLVELLDGHDSEGLQILLPLQRLDNAEHFDILVFDILRLGLLARIVLLAFNIVTVL